MSKRQQLFWLALTSTRAELALWADPDGEETPIYQIVFRQVYARRG